MKTTTVSTKSWAVFQLNRDEFGIIVPNGSNVPSHVLFTSIMLQGQRYDLVDTQACGAAKFYIVTPGTKEQAISLAKQLGAGQVKDLTNVDVASLTRWN